MKAKVIMGLLSIGLGILLFLWSVWIKVRNSQPMKTIMPGESLIHRGKWQLWKMYGLYMNGLEIFGEINTID
jgi:hypothetical protein